ncbi:SMI1/KNR4 family protein [Vitiosangium sp. GDMCC 1.1324]|uniref:SMI1/KNR4 family protein n=1 Tax=Vitiosangium sp. (strain GDMCC 1.1324) TaxID=2138576 RepID=UPI000D3DB998|nr:SMI1/KNR4 family protein [Vitiosangium sp. GDMCC 1.1324]PTL79954.1 hypothetical protein DAT35_31530 [Vitiosangium sp. GDMCC 1.1324]
MNASDLQRIERELDIELPPSYRRLMERFPIAALAGNTDTELWDDADGLIQLNRELRRGRVGEPWPEHLFSIGHRDSAVSAINLSSPEARVWWIDRHLEAPGTQRDGQGFESWAREYVEDWRENLLMDAINPDGMPEVRRRVLEERGSPMDWLLLLVTAATGFGLAWLFVLLKRWLLG